MGTAEALTVGSLFAGIGGFDLALERSGFRASWQVEINPHAQSVLRHHWPTADLHADVSECGKGNLDPVYLICGGFPCQDLSVAGKRAGLVGRRSGLFYQMTRIVNELRPAFLLWENVPGLLSSRHGRDFLAVLIELDRIGYSGAWTTLDAQFFGLAQRRRRIFGLFARADIGARRCAEILALATRCEGNPPKGGKAAEGVAACLRSRSHKPGISEPGRGGEDDENLVVAGPLTACAPGARMRCDDSDNQHFVISDKGSSTWTEGRPTGSASDDNGTNHLVFVHPRQLRNSQSSNQVGIKDDGLSDSLTSEGPGAVAFNWQSGGDVRLGCSETHVPALHQGQVPAVGGHLISHALRAEGHDASEDGTGRGVPLVVSNDSSPGVSSNIVPTLRVGTGLEGMQHAVPSVQAGIMVRRLTPLECCRLQGFPDGWLDIDPPLADSAKYRLLGNAVAVPVVEWIGRRIMEYVDGNR